MKQLAVCLIVFLLFACDKNDSDTKNPSGTIEQILTFGGTKNESAQSVIATSDGGFAVFGFTQSSDSDISDKINESFDYWLLKFDVNSNLQWSKTYGGSGDDKGYDILQTNDGGFLLLGSSNSLDGDVSSTNGQRDLWLVKVDSSGEISWETSYGFAGNDDGFFLLETSDGNYLLSGTLDVTASNGDGNFGRSQYRHAGGDYWLLKISPSGYLIWSRYFGGTFTDTAYGIAETNSGNFFVAGSSDSNDVDIKNNKGSYDFWLVKTETNGNLSSEFSFGGSEIDEAYAIAKHENKFYLVGDTRSDDKDVSINNGGADVWWVEIDENGIILSEKTFGGTSFDAARSISRTFDNGFIISGSSRSSDGNLSNNNGQNDAWVFKTDLSGNLLWQASFGGSNIDFAYDAVQLLDGSYVAVGETQSNDGDIETNKGFSDLLIVKLK